jgi:hypothetical protein
MKIKLPLFLITFLFVQAISLNAQNLVVNGDFEDEGGWNYSNTHSITEGSRDEGVGTKVMNIIAAAGTNSSNMTQTVAGIEAGERYKLSLWYKAYENLPETQGLTIDYRWRKNATSNISGHGFVNSGYLFLTENEWMPYETDEITAPATATHLYLIIAANMGLKVFLDDITLVKVSEGVITGIDAVEEQPLSVRAKSGSVTVRNAPAGSRIDVYNVVGSRLQSAVAAQGETVIPNLPKGQVLIVRSGNEAAKVLSN